MNRTKIALNITRINMVPFFLQNSQQKFYPKNGSFRLFSINQNYAETTLLIDMKIISQEASYAAQQSLTRVKFPKICANCLKFIFKQRFWVLYCNNHIYWLSSENFFSYTGFQPSINFVELRKRFPVIQLSYQLTKSFQRNS